LSSGKATVQSLASHSLVDTNDEVVPTRVKPVGSVDSVQPDGWTHIFPHASVTVIALERK